MESSAKITLRPPRVYLELARASMTSLHPPATETSGPTQDVGAWPIDQATLALMSINVSFSYLAIEAFVNEQLFDCWERKDATAQSLFGAQQDFRSALKAPPLRALKDRVKALCDVLNVAQLHEAEPQLWQAFLRLVDESRHFLVHPSPDPDEFQQGMRRLFLELPAGHYTETAARIIGHFFRGVGKAEPIWLTTNGLFRFRGIELIADPDDGRPAT